MFRFHFCRSVFFLSIFLASTFISACSSSDSSSSPPSPAAPSISAKLFKPADNSELERWLKSELKKSYQARNDRYFYVMSGAAVTTGVAISSVGTATPQASGNSAADSYSTTNVQEKGVDEGDLVTVADAAQLKIKQVVALPEIYGFYTLYGQSGGVMPTL